MSEQAPGGYPPQGGQTGYPPQGGPGGYSPQGGPGGFPPQGYQGYPPGQGSGPGWQQPPEILGPAPGVRWASHGARLGAYILDGIIVGILFTLVAAPLSILLAGSALDQLRQVVDTDGYGMTPADAWELARPLLVLVPIIFALSILVMAYFVVGWARGGQTLGMKAAGIRVVRDRDGGRIGWGAAIVRLIGYWVSGAVMWLGFIWILIDSRRRGWHDLLAGTVVISDR